MGSKSEFVLEGQINCTRSKAGYSPLRRTIVGKGQEVIDIQGRSVSTVLLKWEKNYHRTTIISHGQSEAVSRFLDQRSGYVGTIKF